MGAWATVIAAFLQLVILVLNNWFNKDAQDKARKEKLHAELADAIKAGDTARINNILDGLRF